MEDFVHGLQSRDPLMANVEFNELDTSMKFEQTPEATFTTLHSLRNLSIGSLSQSIFAWQAFPA
jgi:hypothetical protein